MNICIKVWGNFEGIGETLGKYRMLDVNSMGSKGLSGPMDYFYSVPGLPHYILEAQF